MDLVQKLPIGKFLKIQRLSSFDFFFSRYLSFANEVISTKFSPSTQMKLRTDSLSSLKPNTSSKYFHSETFFKLLFINDLFNQYALVSAVRNVSKSCVKSLSLQSTVFACYLMAFRSPLVYVVGLLLLNFAYLLCAQTEVTIPFASTRVGPVNKGQSVLYKFLGVQIESKYWNKNSASVFYISRRAINC